MRTKIMYIENKSAGLSGEARIGRVTFSKSGKSLRCQERTFETLKGGGATNKSNYIDIDTREEFWISGCKKDGSDRLYGERLPIFIDDDTQEEYWVEIRNKPAMLGTV